MSEHTPRTLIGHVSLSDLRMAYGAYGELSYLVQPGDAFMRAECRSCGWDGLPHHFNGATLRQQALDSARHDEQQHAATCPSVRAAQAQEGAVAA